MEVVATGETDLEAREEIAGRVLSASGDFGKWERLLWWERGKWRSSGHVSPEPFRDTLL